MQIRKAVAAETEKVTAMMQDAAIWLKNTGSSQWQEVLEGTDKHNLTGAVEKQEVYFFCIDDTIIGMAAVWHQPSEWDKKLWAQVGFASDAYYIHRVIVHPNYRGKNYGSEMLTTIKRYFSGIAGELRLDCLASNKKLTAFYQRNHFVQQGIARSNTGDEFFLFCQRL